MSADGERVPSDVVLIGEDYAEVANELSRRGAVIIGSIARYAMMGQKEVPMYRPDGERRDIDFISLLGHGIDGNPPAATYFASRKIPLDWSITKHFRPEYGDWGLYLPSKREPFARIDNRECKLVDVDAPWANPEHPLTIRALPPRIQESLLDLTFQIKDPLHAAKFKESVREMEPLSSQTQQAFDEYKKEYKEFQRKSELPSTASKAIHFVSRAFRSTKNVTRTVKRP